MCGIFLFIDKTEKIHKSSLNKVKKVCDEFIEPRGPDFFDIEVGDNYIAYQSILSLSLDKESGHEYRRKKLNTLFVGEFFQFKGKEELEYIYKVDSKTFYKNDYDGFYAIIWKNVRNKVLSSVQIRTDPQGEKRLFYINNDKHLIISSVPGALTSFLISRKLSLPYFLRYLGSKHAISYDDSFFSEMKQFKGGDLYSISKDKNYKIYKDYSYDYSKWFDSSTPNTCIDLKHELDNRLTGIMDEFTTHGQNLGSGAIVSGGADSSLQAHYLSRTNVTGIKYFTVKFLTKDCASSEIDKFKELIGINNENHFIYTMSSDEYLYYAYECIKVSASVIPTHSMPSSMFIAEKMGRENIRTIYSGEGADELFLGYGTYLDGRHSDDYHSIYSKVIDKFQEISGFNKTKQKAFDTCQANLPESMTESDLQLKVSSFMDFFIQCRSVGFFASDIGMGNYGLEARSSFARRSVASLALGALPKLLLEPNLKQPLKELYTEKLLNTPAQKAGFAGFPNEIGQSITLPELNDKEKGYFYEVRPFHTQRDYEWKMINYKLFKLYFNVEIE